MSAPSRPSHHPAGYIMAAAALAVAAGAALALCSSTTGCSAATMAAVGPQIVADMSEACPAMTAIPMAGPFVAAACEGAEGIVGAAVAAAKQELATQADAGTDAGAPLDAKTLKPLYVTRNGKRVKAGYVSACLCAAAQRHLDAHASPADAGTDASLPMAPAVPPMADAGRDGAP